jgi:cytochrome c peroxidase
MHGVGSFFDPRLDDAAKFPIAAKNRFGHVVVDEEHDRVTPKLPGLHLFQMSLPAPTPPADFFDQAAAERGDELFSGKARCTTCHVEPLTTEPGWNLHTPAEVGIDDFQAQRAPDDRYRTAPLHGLFTHTKGGFYHDGRFATLLDVVEHYDQLMSLGLSSQEKGDVVEYLKSL